MDTPKKKREVHSFLKSKEVGAAVEKLLDAHFMNLFTIEEVDLDTQKRGIDRIYTHPESGAVATVEYKADTRSLETGNLFIEVWSNKQSKKKGWAYTSQAQWLYFYVVDYKEVCIIEMTKLKRLLKGWNQTYKKATACNRSSDGFYNSEGILVPLEDFKKECIEIVKIT
jgi:hypothetical protein